MTNMKNILVALDLREQEGDRALTLAFEFAAVTDALVHLVHVLAVKGASNLAALPPTVVRDALASAAERLKMLAVPFRDSSRLGEQVVRTGETVPTLLQIARDHHADLIVLSGPHRSGINRALLGSVAEGVLRQASCPVLLVRPTKSP
jgi:nucleotide-binding universal stress UspA family protein